MTLNELAATIEPYSRIFVQLSFLYDSKNGYRDLVGDDCCILPNVEIKSLNTDMDMRKFGDCTVIQTGIKMSNNKPMIFCTVRIDDNKAADFKRFGEQLFK